MVGWHHTAADGQHRSSLCLAGIGVGRQLGIPEGIHDTVVADPVTGAEILVGAIVKHAPAKAARMFSVHGRIVLDPQMPQGVLLPFLPGIEGFCGVFLNECF